jgi:hypothetical protein
MPEFTGLRRFTQSVREQGHADAPLLIIFLKYFVCSLSGSLANAVSKLAELRSFDIGSNRFIGELPAGLFETTAQLERLKCDRHSSCTSVNKTHLSATVDDTVLMYSE